MGGRGASGGKSVISEKRRSYRQAETRVRKSIKSYEKRIIEHEGYIKNPKQKFNDWEGYSETRKQTELRHWNHEINAFKGNIEKEKQKLKGFENED